MADLSTQHPEPLIKWAFIISALGGIITGVACLVNAADYNGLNCAACLGAAALAFGLTAIALKRN